MLLTNDKCVVEGCAERAYVAKLCKDHYAEAFNANRERFGKYLNRVENK